MSLEQKTVVQLRAMATERQIPGRSKLTTKAMLIEALQPKKKSTKKCPDDLVWDRKLKICRESKRKKKSNPLSDLLNSKVLIKDTNTIIINDIIFTYFKPLSEDMYIYKSGKYMIAIKERRTIDELWVIDKLKKSNFKCNSYIVPYTFYKNTIIMEKYDGDLIDYYYNDDIKINPKISKQILEHIVKGLICLINIGLYYTDIKLDNILYKTENGKTIFSLGDIGSMYINSKNNSTITYPPIDRNKDDGHIKYAKESDISWGVGILIAQMFYQNMKPYVFTVISKMTLANHKQFVDNLVKVAPKFEYLIRGTLEPNASRRLSLKEIEIFLSKM